METLNSHEDIQLEGELYNHTTYQEVLDLHRAKEEKFAECIDYLENKIIKMNKYIGCKILINQLLMISTDFPGYFIRHYQDANFIFLTRENMIETQLSLKIAHTYKRWHCKKSEDIKKRTVHIDPKELYSKLERSRNRREKYQDLLKTFGVRKFHLTYEALFENKAKMIGEICGFLGIDAGNIEFSNEKKGNPFRAEEIVENFGEVEQFLRHHPYYHEMLIVK
jgi:LPS sulfotransferase NodH